MGVSLSKASPTQPRNSILKQPTVCLDDKVSESKLSKRVNWDLEHEYWVVKPPLEKVHKKLSRFRKPLPTSQSRRPRKIRGCSQYKSRAPPRWAASEEKQYGHLRRYSQNESTGPPWADSETEQYSSSETEPYSYPRTYSHDEPMGPPWADSEAEQYSPPETEQCSYPRTYSQDEPMGSPWADSEAEQYGLSETEQYSCPRRYSQDESRNLPLSAASEGNEGTVRNRRTEEAERERKTKVACLTR
jgi:hypothetical protein